MIPMYGHGICLAPHTPSTKVIDFSMSFIYGIQGARHILIFMHDDDATKKKKLRKFIHQIEEEKKKPKAIEFVFVQIKKAFFCL